MSSELKNTVQEITGGLLINLSDVLLYSVYLFGSSFGKSNTSRGIYQSFQEADEMLSQFNTKTIINLLKRLHYQQKYIALGKSQGKEIFSITPEGEKRIKDIMPYYKSERDWDGSFFLINFDIPEKNRRTRLMLRKKLKSFGVGMVQESLWITPYDPSCILTPMYPYLSDQRQLIYTKVDQKHLFPYSSKDIPALMQQIFHLNELDYRYSRCIFNSVKNKSRNIYEYLNILKDDPQLPFELEPVGFKAKEAYTLFRGTLRY